MSEQEYDAYIQECDNAYYITEEDRLFLDTTIIE